MKSTFARETMFDGYRKLKPGHIHLRCPGCGRKVSNVPKAEYDPKSAALLLILCGKDNRCGSGGFIEGGDYFDAKGELVKWWEQEPA